MQPASNGVPATSGGGRVALVPIAKAGFLKDHVSSPVPVRWRAESGGVDFSRVVQVVLVHAPHASAAGSKDEVAKQNTLFLTNNNFAASHGHDRRSMKVLQ